MRGAFHQPCDPCQPRQIAHYEQCRRTLQLNGLRTDRRAHAGLGLDANHRIRRHANRLYQPILSCTKYNGIESIENHGDLTLCLRSSFCAAT